MNAALRWLGLDAARWERVGPQSLWSGAALVIVASGLLALNRFGGLATSAPRAFLRMTLIGVWGWIGLSLAVWVAVGLLVEDRPPLRHTFALSGWAHVPVVALAGVIFVAAVLMQFLGPGRIAAAFVFVAWFPVALVTGVRHVLGVSRARAAAALAVPYVAWFAIVGRHLLGQVEHLL